MINYPSGTLLIKKVDGNNNFIEDSLMANDIPISASGADYQASSVTGTTIQEFADKIPSKIRSTHKIIKSLSDFPTPVANQIILTSGYTYELNGLINLNNNSLVLANNVVIHGNNPLSDSLLYSGSDNMVKGSGVSASIYQLGIGVSSGSFISYSGGVEDILNLQLINFGHAPGETAVTNLGNIIGGEVVRLDRCHFSNLHAGITFSGTVDTINISNCYFHEPGVSSGIRIIEFASGINLQSVLIASNHFDYQEVNNSYIYSLDSITPSAGILLTGNAFTGSGTVISGGLNIDSNLYLISRGNAGLADNMPYGYLQFAGNATATTIANTTGYVVAAGANTGAKGTWFNTATNNRLIYSGVLKSLKGARVDIAGSISSAAANQTLRVALWKFTAASSSSAQLGEVETRTGTANQSVPFTYNDIVDLKKDDYLEVRVRNTTGVNNVTVEYLQFRVIGGI